MIQLQEDDIQQRTNNRTLHTKQHKKQHNNHQASTTSKNISNNKKRSQVACHLCDFIGTELWIEKAATKHTKTLQSLLISKLV